MVTDQEKFFNLAKVCNSTFGTRGPGETDKLVAQSIKFQAIDENTLKVSFQTIVNFITPGMVKEIKDKHKKEALSLIEKAIKSFAKEYKDQFGKTVTLTIKDKSMDDNIEMVSYSVYNKMNRAFYRFHCVVEVK